MKTILVDAVFTFIKVENDEFKMNHDMYTMLERFPNRKIIVTNADDDQLKEFGLVDMPYDVFTLKHKPDKTDPDYFKKLFSHYNLKPTEVIYFEHNPEAVESARSVDIKAYNYDPDTKDLVALEDFLKENL